MFSPLAHFNINTSSCRHMLRHSCSPWSGFCLEGVGPVLAADFIMEILRKFLTILGRDQRAVTQAPV